MNLKSKKPFINKELLVDENQETVMLNLFQDLVRTPVILKQVQDDKQFVKFIEYTPGLYIVSTPIGHLEDITIRALNTLKSSTVILCEDTRNTQKLLAKHNISSRLMVYNDHSTDKQRIMVAKLIDQGGIVSLVSDAGTPLISDPGFKLIRHIKSLSHFVEVIPGVSAPIAALTLSGLATDKFLFAGFLPKTSIKKQKIFTELSEINATLIFFETANRLTDSLSCAISVLGNREACVARELTKLYQEVKTLSLQELVDYYKTHPPKGEIVLLISGASNFRHERRHAEFISASDSQESSRSRFGISSGPAGMLKQVQHDDVLVQDNLTKILRSYLAQGHSKKSAAELFIKQYGNFYSKNELYKVMNNL